MLFEILKVTATWNVVLFEWPDIKAWSSERIGQENENILTSRLHCKSDGFSQAFSEKAHKDD